MGRDDRMSRKEIRRMEKRDSAKYKSSARRGVSGVDAYGGSAARKAAAAKLRAQRKGAAMDKAYNNRRILTNAERAAGEKQRLFEYDERIRRHKIKKANKAAALAKSNAKTGLSPSAPKGGSDRKAKAAELKQRRSMERFMRRNSAAIVAQRNKETAMLGRVKTKTVQPKAQPKPAKRTFQSVELARKLKSRGYKVTIARGGGGSTVHGTKMGKKGGSVSLTASAKGRKIIGSPTWAPTIHRNSGAGGKRGWGRVVGGKGPRTEAQRRASIANLKKGRASRMRKGK